MAGFQKYFVLAFYCFFIAAGSFLATVFCAFVVGELFSFVPELMAWDHTGEYGPWMGILFAAYSFYLAVPISLFLTWRMCRARTKNTNRSEKRSL